MTTPTPGHPHPTPDAPHIAVRGEAHLEADPEIARVGITLTARGKDRRATFDDLTRRNATTLDLLKSYGDAVEHLETGHFSLAPELAPRGRGERVRTYHGSVHLTVEFGDFTALGELATKLADHDLTRLDGPSWSLRPDSPVHARARRQAVKEAVQRAREYAEALGTTLAALLEIADIGADIPQPYPAGPGRARSMAFAGPADDTPAPLDLEPQRQEIHAAVNARFTLVPPRL
ncbi:SIMPL domain-containing protein [Streptomyces sp. NPDC101249]|uniref:SIMPL domain-containing protein n=1 Tax=Streptomyces sp. NPDC101249 TaxID=3366140 RepID=UPI003816D639